MEIFDVAQICLHGHIVNDSTMSFPQDNSPVCKICGAKTITNCPVCGEPIQGALRTSERFDIPEYIEPAYCHHCGNLYPWSVEKIDTALDFFIDHKIITSEQKLQMKEMIVDLVEGTDNNKLSTLHVKSYLKSLSSGDVESVKGMIGGLLNDSAKQSMFSAL